MQCEIVKRISITVKKVHAFLEDENIKGVACLNMTERKVGKAM